MGREQQLAEALVGLADSLADDIDPVVLVERLARNCVDITEADAVGIMVVSGRGDLRTLAVTEEDADAPEFFQLQADGARAALRGYADGHRRLVDTAHSLVRRALSPDAVLAAGTERTT